MRAWKTVVGLYRVLQPRKMPESHSYDKVMDLLERLNPTGRVSEAKFEGVVRAFYIGVRGLRLTGSLKGMSGIGDGGGGSGEGGGGSGAFDHKSSSHESVLHHDSELDRAFRLWVRLYDRWVMSEMDMGARKSAADSMSFVPGGLATDGSIDVLLMRYAMHWCAGSMAWGRFVLDRAFDHGAVGKTQLKTSSAEQVLLLPVPGLLHRAELLEDFRLAVLDVIGSQAGGRSGGDGAAGLGGDGAAGLGGDGAAASSRLRAAASALSSSRASQRIPSKISVLTLQRALSSPRMSALFEHPVLDLLRRTGPLSILSAADVHRDYILCKYEKMFAPAPQTCALKMKRLLLAEHKARSFLNVITSRMIVTRWRAYARIRRNGRLQLQKLCKGWRRLRLVRTYRQLRLVAYEHACAVQMQAFARMVPRRLGHLSFLARRRLARAVESAWMAFNWRRYRQRIVRHRHASAMVIQSEFRAYRMRKRFVTAVVAASLREKKRTMVAQLRRAKSRASIVIQAGVRKTLARREAEQRRAAAVELADFERQAERIQREALEVQQTARAEVAELVQARLDKRHEDWHTQLAAKRTKGEYLAQRMTKERQHMLEERRDRDLSMKQQHHRLMLEKNAEWDRTEITSLDDCAKQWHDILYGGRPPAGNPERIAKFERAMEFWKPRATEIAATTGVTRAAALHQARDEFKQDRVQELRMTLAKQRRAQLKALAARLREEYKGLLEEIQKEEEAFTHQAATRIQHFYKAQTAAAAIRLQFYLHWERDYSLLTGRTSYVHKTTRQVIHKKPGILGTQDLEVHNRWRQHTDSTGTPYFFHPRTHVHTYTAPSSVVLCQACQAAFATRYCDEQDCGVYCEACYYDYHVTRGHGPGHTFREVDGSDPDFDWWGGSKHD